MKQNSIMFSTYHFEFIILSILSPILAGAFMHYVLPPYDVGFSPLAYNILTGLEFWWITSIIIVTTLSVKHSLALITLPALALVANAVTVYSPSMKIAMLFTALSITWVGSIVYCMYDWYNWYRLQGELDHVDHVDHVDHGE